MASAIKKTLQHPKANEEVRTHVKEKIKGYEEEGKAIVYLDESGFAKDMPRTHGYSEKGKRCYGTRDWHAKGRVNAIGAIVSVLFLTVGLFDTHIDSDIFYTWLTQELLPKMPVNSVFVMDNASFHKREDIQEAIRQKGIILEYLPSYSPDLNPIEHKWAQAKVARKRYRCDDIDALFPECLDYAIL